MDVVYWTESAIQDLNDIGDYISKGSQKYAEITVNYLFDATEILEEFPYSGKIVQEFNKESIRELIRGNYRIVYLINDDKLVIVVIKIGHRREIYKKL